MAPRRVVVTGVGAISAAGTGLEALADALARGRSGIGPLRRFPPPSDRCAIAAEAPEPPRSGSEVPWRRTSRPDRLALAAAREAVAAAGLEPDALAGAAVVLGTGTGGAHLAEDYLAALLADPPRRPRPSLLLPHPPSASTDLVATQLGALGPRATIMTACSSSAMALGAAADQLRLGRAAVALAGGAEGLCRLTFAGFSALRALSPEPCRPFDAERRGLTLGEGAAVLVLEEAAHARARGARPLAELRGWGAATDAHHLTAPDPTGGGAARAIRAALADAGLDPGAIDYVNAHGTGTAQNDPAETRALKAGLGRRAAAIPISSIKPLLGHTLGAAGALEAAACVVALSRALVPATLGLGRPDPECDLDFVPGAARRQPLGACLSLSLAFGGSNVALLLCQPEA